MTRGYDRGRWRRQSVAAARRDGQRADQDPTCPNGERGCPGPDSPADALPCSACFLEGADAEEGSVDA